MQGLTDSLLHWAQLFSWGDQGWGDEFVQAAVMTVLLSTASYIFGIVVGLIAACLKVWGWFPLRWLMEVYTTVIRGVPELLIIYLLFFGNEAAINAILGLMGITEPFRLNEFVIGVLAVGLISGSYATEVLRGAIQVIPHGQIEAGRAFGMHGFMVFRRIILPQTIRLALPGLGNIWQLILKDTALVSVVGVTELMRISQVAARSTREPFPFFITAAVLFLVITTFSTKLFRKAETHYDRGVRRAG
jgi:octopine/nopaline transport system permease protein